MGTQLPKKGAQPPPQFSAHVCSQMAGWIKMPLGTEVGLGPGDIVLDGDPAPTPKKGHSPPIFGSCLLWPNRWIKMLHGTKVGVGPGHTGHIVLDGDPKGHSPQFSAHGRPSQLLLSICICVLFRMQIVVVIPADIFNMLEFTRYVAFKMAQLC